MCCSRVRPPHWEVFVFVSAVSSFDDNMKAHCGSDALISGANEARLKKLGCAADN